MKEQSAFTVIKNYLKPASSLAATVAVASAIFFVYAGSYLHSQGSPYNYFRIGLWMYVLLSPVIGYATAIAIYGYRKGLTVSLMAAVIMNMIVNLVAAEALRYVLSFNSHLVVAFYNFLVLGSLFLIVRTSYKITRGDITYE